MDSISNIDRPFFSIIVPCYNSKPERIRELLESIYKGGCSINDIEVIISDDRSTDKSYLDVVMEYSEKLFIRIYSVPDVNDEGVRLIHCPGNTRQNGVNHATGRWLTFIDHDDLFVGGALKKVKDIIEEANEQYLACCNFYHTNPYDNSIIEEVKHTTNWMHGKFYNLDNLWKKYNLHYKTNLFGNEDICVSAQVNDVWFRINKDKVDIRNCIIPTLWIEDFVYNWRAWNDSTSNMMYKNNYMEEYFIDYLNGVMGTYVDDYNMLKESGQLDEKDIEYYKLMQADVIIYSYYYLQSFKFNHSNEYDLNIEFMIKKHIKDYYKRFNTTCIDLYNYIDYHEPERGEWVYNIWENVTKGVGPFVEVDSFFDFLSK